MPDTSVRKIESAWRKSSFSGPNGGNCVEVAEASGGMVAMRNSRDPEEACCSTPGRRSTRSFAVPKRESSMI